MNWGLARLLLIWLGAAVLLTGARAPQPEYFPISTTCHASATLSENYANLVAEPWRWDCEDGNWSIKAPRSFVRIDLRGSGVDRPDAFSTRLTRFDAMRLTVIGDDGRIASRDVTEADMKPATSDWLMRVALPKVTGKPEVLIVRIDGARHAGMLSDATVIAATGDSPATLRHELFIAGICGTLILPMLFNLAAYRVLRERFILWHGLATALMLVHTLVSSGLINRFADLSITQLSVISACSIGGVIVAASFFSADFLEEGKLDPIQRRLSRSTGLWVIPWTAFYLIADGPLRPYAAQAYLASFMPLMALFAWVMIVAKRRGSRAVNFQIAAWTPVMLTALVRIGSSLGLADSPIEVLTQQHFAMALEVIVTSLGIADRFMTLRMQRDRAWAQSRRFEEMAGQDPLTGLFNRRGVEERFGELYAEGFETMALLDLDHFKQVNDLHGHAKGDEVLRATALALAPDDDTLAMRLGGEEFMLLLRGKDSVARAERRRQAISLRIAADVSGLERVVTASMGMVQHPPDGALKADFATLYAHCDRLLYEAKHAGRNRTMREKLQSFGVAKGRASAA